MVSRLEFAIFQREEHFCGFVVFTHFSSVFAFFLLFYWFFLDIIT